jgi:uncharacterized OB-fold protein
MLTGFVGGICKDCGTIQYPKQHICINPECRSIGSQTDYSLSDCGAVIASFTIDWLAYSPHPPLVYGMVQFKNGAKVMLEFTGFHPDEIEVGMNVKMVFRVKDIEKQRNFRNYYWKVAPLLNGIKKETV